MPHKQTIDTSFIPDLPSTSASPLTAYRKNAKFDWKLLRIYIEGENCLRAKYEIWNKLESEPLFNRPSVTPSADEQQKLAALRVKRVMELRFLTNEVKNFPYQKRVSLFCWIRNMFKEVFFSLS